MSLAQNIIVENLGKIELGIEWKVIYTLIWVCHKAKHVEHLRKIEIIIVVMSI